MAMKKTIPASIVKQFIFDILIKRRNKEMQAVEKMQEKEMAELGYTTEYSNSAGWEASTTGVIADCILDGVISVKEAIQEYLDSDEKEIVKNKCREWIEQHQEVDREI